MPLDISLTVIRYRAKLYIVMAATFVVALGSVMNLYLHPYRSYRSIISSRSKGIKELFNFRRDSKYLTLLIFVFRKPLFRIRDSFLLSATFKVI